MKEVRLNQSESRQAEWQRTQTQGMGAESKKEIINAFLYVLSFALITVSSSEFKRFENG